MQRKPSSTEDGFCFFIDVLKLATIFDLPVKFNKLYHSANPEPN